MRSAWAKCLTILLLLLTAGEYAFPAPCAPTRWDQIGPFYRPNAPVRNKIGTGYLLQGTVRAAGSCRPIVNARIEIWQAGPDGTYDDAHRATIYAGKDGRYRLETSMPPPYGGRPPHIHILVDAKGFDGLITQHYPRKRGKSATFDLVLNPEKEDSVKSRDASGR